MSRGVLLLLWLTGITSGAAAQQRISQAAAPSPASLAELVLTRFSSGSPEAFDSVYPFERGRGLVRFAAERKLPRPPGIARVLSTESDRAVLLLSGYVKFGNSGDETIYSDGFSGLYEARRGTGGWHLSERLPLAGENRIHAQALGVHLEPGRGLRITDTLDISIRDRTGFTARLNHTAKIREVRLNGRSVRLAFGGGVLWISAKTTERGRLVLSYEIDVAQDSSTNANSGRFGPVYGHVRNQYFWHPRLDESGADLADFRITVRAPGEFRVATDLPQSERTAGAVRTVHARTSQPTSALSLFYDRDWRPQERQAGNFRFAAFVTPSFSPSTDSLVLAFQRAHRVLSRSFGEPPAAYFAIVQGRAREGAGWLYLSNNASVAAENGGTFGRGHPAPRAFFGHEVAHGWTRPTGAARNLLTEGWATFAESLLLREEFGEAVERTFWERERNLYETGGYEGQASILEDPLNSGVSYHKGAWIFRMLREIMGDSAFVRGMRQYMAIPAGRPAGLEEFTAALSRTAGQDLAPFLRPWIQEKAIPDVYARLENGRVILSQRGPVFRLPVELELMTAAGPVRRTVQLDQQSVTLDVSGLGAVTDVLIDPDHRLLLKRHRGETVNFELRAPEAKEVSLAGNFTSKPVPATRQGDIWSVTIPLTAGRYAFYWNVDGKSSDPELRLIRPVRELENPYPR
jgi:hypothetical protein